MAGKSDQILIEGIKKQDRKVIAEIYNEYFPSVKQYIYKHNGNLTDARDVFHDAIIIVLEKIRDDDIVLRCSLKTYVYAVCRNLWFKKLKMAKEDFVSFNEIDDSLEGSEQIEEELMNFNYARLLYQKHLVRMTVACRTLITKFISGKSFKTITKEMNYKSESYARKRKYRCIKMLMKRIKADPNYKKINDDDQDRKIP